MGRSDKNPGSSPPPASEQALFTPPRGRPRNEEPRERLSVNLPESVSKSFWLRYEDVRRSRKLTCPADYIEWLLELDHELGPQKKTFRSGFKRIG